MTSEKEPKELSAKRQSFVNAYLGEAKSNGSEAARRAGYKDAAKAAYRLLREPEIREAIERRLLEDAMSAGEVLKLLTEHARASLGDFLTWDETGEYHRVDLKKAADAGKLHLLKSIELGRLGSAKIELVDPQSAAVQLGRYHKLFVDRSEHVHDMKGLPPALLAIGQLTAGAMKELLEDARRALLAGGLADGAGDLRPAGPETGVVGEAD